MQRARRAAEALSAARAKMQRDLTVALGMMDLPTFVLVWGTGAGTNSSVPENISHMTKQELAVFVWMLGYGSIEHIRNGHAGQRRYTFFIYLAFASKAAHVSCSIGWPTTEGVFVNPGQVPLSAMFMFVGERRLRPGSLPALSPRLRVGPNQSA